jgi:asparagine synthase (glutamine-hydrolysing)
VKRWIAGTFDTHGAVASSRLAGALAPERSSFEQRGALRVAYTGAPSLAREPLCVFDGYLDNAAELSAQLGAPCGLMSEELIALAWQEWGQELARRLRGDFVLLLWDSAGETGLLVRDQLGARALFLSDVPGGICFAGELRYLLALLPRRPAPDRVSVAHWLATSSRPGSATLYEGVRRLNPGAVLLLDRAGARERRYWTPRYEQPLAGSSEQLAGVVAQGLGKAVRRRIDPDGLTGVLMSGGLDSASVAALASQAAPDRVIACSALFPEHPAVDESALIEQLASQLALRPIVAEVRAGGMLQSAFDAIAEWQLPLRSWGDFWALPLLRAAAAAGAQRMLGGDGGDELFAVRAYLLADRLRAGRADDAFALLGELPGAGAGPGRAERLRTACELALLGALPYGLHEPARRFASSSAPPSWLRPASARELRDSQDPLAWKRLDGPRWWAHAAHGLTRGIEESGIFEHHRRRSESAGIETRHPLLDLDLVELGLRLAPRASFDPHRNRPMLRAAMAGLLAENVRRRPQKALFDSLLIDCLDRRDGAIVRRLLVDPRSELRAYVDLDELERTLFASDRLKREQPFRWMWQLWRLVNAECWLRVQAGRPIELQASAPRVAIRSSAHPREHRDSYVFPP